MRYEAEAPSNIALIKYMGKTDASQNRPTNASISFTLDHLKTKITAQVLAEGERSDQWEPLIENGYSALELSEKGRERFLKHFSFLKSELKIPGFYLLKSANNFPSDCGLASSASSFAALTRVAYEIARERSEDLEAVEALGLEDLAELSRQGSGSSCRSFFTPFALWTERGVELVDVPRSRWLHSAVLVEASKKSVSSSEAHKRVSQSLLFTGRPERAEARLGALLTALQRQSWSEAFELCWAEFWDMHALFETSVPAFGYMEPASLRVLQQIRASWKNEGDGPLVTMDAGANIHLLYREDQKSTAERNHLEFSKQFRVISSWRGIEEL